MPVRRDEAVLRQKEPHLQIAVEMRSSQETTTTWKVKGPKSFLRHPTYML